MPDSEYRVGIVVDRQFGERLYGLAERIHVWAIDSPINRPVAERVWNQLADSGLERGVTLFRAKADEVPDESVAQILGDVDLHHGAYSHTPPVSTLEI
jgi:hypothetical protein